MTQNPQRQPPKPKKSHVVRNISILLGVFIAMPAAGCCGILGRMFVGGSVNPFHDIQIAILGEPIEVKETTFGPRPQRTLIVDSINRGMQFRMDDRNVNEKPWNRIPTTYYHVGGPVGAAMEKVSWFPFPPDVSWQINDLRMPASLTAAGAGGDPWSMLVTAWGEPPVGVIMMQAGTLAAYARPFQTFDFYERSPEIKALSLAKDGRTPSFTYLKDALVRGANIRVIDGDERTNFDKSSPKNFYHLLFVEGAHGHSDHPVTSLFTKEALKGYMDSLTPDGLVLIHTSSRNFNLPYVVAATSDSLGLDHLILKDEADLENKTGAFSSEWVAVSRDRNLLNQIAKVRPRPLGERPRTLLSHRELARPNFVWSDSENNSLRLVRR